MNIFKAFGQILQSTTNVVVKTCSVAEQVVEHGGGAVVNLTIVGEEATKTMVEESKIEREQNRKRLMAEADALDIQL